MYQQILTIFFNHLIFVINWNEFVGVCLNDIFGVSGYFISVN